MAGQMVLSSVKGLEQGHDVLLIGLGGGGEARLVDAVVDEVIHPFMSLVDGGLEALRVQINGAVLLCDHIIELWCN